MAKPKKISVLTTTRADYGLLYWLMKAIDKSKKLNLELIVSGTHLSEEHGSTWKFIEQDGFRIQHKVEILSGNNEASGIGESAGNMLKKLSLCLAQNKPDALVLLGDRFEVLSSAQAAVICSVPVIHLHGGEISEGANDDLFRHAITKLSALHFTSNKEHRDRVIQLGEHPSRVKVSGALGIENIKKLKLLAKEKLEDLYGIKLNEKVFLVTFHPATMEKEKPEQQFSELLKALESFKDASIFISKANADAGGDLINEMIEKFSKSNQNVRSASSFGQLNYLSLMKEASVVIGNSSSGIIEAPSLFTPTVNIGSRQKGRMCAKSVIHCQPDSKAIYSAINKALKLQDKRLFKNPYDHGNASEMIKKEIETIDLGALLPKKFYDLK